MLRLCRPTLRALLGLLVLGCTAISADARPAQPARLPQTTAAQLWPPLWFFDSPRSTLRRATVGLWQFEQSGILGLDSGPNGFSLTNNNSATQTTGQVGSAVALVAASSQYLSIASQPALTGGAGGASFTLTTWAKPTTLANARELISKGTEYELRLNGTGGNLTWFWDGEVGQIASSANELTTGVWHFIVCWYDAGQGKGFLQIDQGPIYSFARTWAAAAGAADFNLGARSGGAGTFFNGALDETTYYSRALTTIERAWLWANGNGRILP